ncbi:MAG: DegT/DnrJ/EryC1/StrS family aminotransferase [Candidatus Omnitrophica bacterium]|nr:DegT/DnrJ/EryC1/StrS family aminotransferase [Candidatus Omnitrophota bacterium]
MIPLVDLKKQYLSIKKEIDAAINDIIERTAFVGGKDLKNFESRFAEMTGAKYAIGVSSGTTALYVSMIALGLKRSDEVITVPNTFIATSESITEAGGRVVFVDIDEETYNIDVKKLEKAINKKTKAIIPVHLYGQSCDIEGVIKVAQKHNLKVIFDACQSHLSAFKNEPLGKFGDCVCYSFYPGKNLGAYGDGGIITTNDEELARKMWMLIDHGRWNKKYEHDIEGYNCRLDTLQAAILNVKLNYLSLWTRKRQEAAAKYNKLLKDTGLILPKVADYASHVYHLYVIRLKERDKVLKILNDAGIQAGVHYPIPLHLQKAYEYLGHRNGDFPAAEDSCLSVLSLPMFPEISDEEINQVVAVLKQAIK